MYRRLLPPSDESDAVSHFLANVNYLSICVLRDVSDGDMVAITIQNHVNKTHEPIGISFRRKDHLSGDVIWSVFERDSQSNARFDEVDTLIVNVHSAKMPVGFGKDAINCMGRPLSVIPYLREGRENLIITQLTNSGCKSR